MKNLLEHKELSPPPANQEQQDHHEAVTLTDEHTACLQKINAFIMETEQQKVDLCSYNNLRDELRERVDSLENALKESVAIVSERENDFFLLEEQNAELLEKVKKQNQRILSLQNASAMRYTSCREIGKQTSTFKEKVQAFLDDKKAQLPYLYSKLQEVLEILMSELDSQIAGFEVFGARTQEQIERLDQLRSNRNKLNQRLKLESENLVGLMSNCKNLEEELHQLLTTKELILDDHD